MPYNNEVKRSSKRHKKLIDVCLILDIYRKAKGDMKDSLAGLCYKKLNYSPLWNQFVRKP